MYSADCCLYYLRHDLSRLTAFVVRSRASSRFLFNSTWQLFARVKTRLIWTKTSSNCFLSSFTGLCQLMTTRNQKIKSSILWRFHWRILGFTFLRKTWILCFVVARGSSFGGHYHSYIRDVDGLGDWCAAQVDDEPNKSPASKTKRRTSFDDTSYSPDDVITSALAEAEHGKLSIKDLCQVCWTTNAAARTKTKRIWLFLFKKIIDITGLSWSKIFKKKYGPITQVDHDLLHTF